MKKRIPIIFLVGILLIVVMIGTASAQQPVLPFITASQASYASGDVSVVMGYEFQPGQELAIKITGPDGSVLNSKGRKGSDTVVTDSLGQFVYQYPLRGLHGNYSVEAVAVSTSGKGRSSATTETIMAVTNFMGHVNTDLELVVMPDVALYRSTPPPRGGDGLTDAIAGLCLVGTVDLNGVGQTNDIRGFTFDLVVDKQSNQQGPTNALKDFIDQLETVTIGNTADTDTGSSEAPGGYYTTAGNSIISGNPFLVTSADGTIFEVSGPTDGPDGGEITYAVTVSLSNPSTLEEARFEYCARININAGDEDNGTDGFITSDPETGGTEASPINVIKRLDISPPICVVRHGDNNNLLVDVTDSESGVSTVEATILKNIKVEVPINSDDFLSAVGDTKTFNPPEKNSFTMEATLVDPTLSGRVEVKITDAAGNVTVCDPVITLAIRENGQPVSETHADLPAAENKVRVSNNNPGVTNLDIVVNGQLFKVTGLGNNETIVVDVSSAVVDGNNNSFTLTAYGQPGSSADVMIWDGN